MRSPRPRTTHTSSTALGTSQVLGQGFPALPAPEYASKFRITATTLMSSEPQVTKSARSQLQSNPCLSFFFFFLIFFYL